MVCPSSIPFPLFWMEYGVPVGILDIEVTLRMKDFHRKQQDKKDCDPQRTMVAWSDFL